MPLARQRLVFLAALLIISFHFVLAYISDAQPFLDLRAFALGRAPLPFGTRALTAWILRGALHLDSPGLEAALHRFTPAAAGRFDLLAAVVFLLAFVSLLVSILCTRASLQLLTGSARFAAFGCFFVPLMAYFNYILSPDAHFLLPYDLPSLAFFCTLFYCALSRRFAGYYAVFLLACINRETALFMVIFFAVLEHARPAPDRAPTRRIAAHIAAQVALWIVIKLWLHHLYGHNPAEAGSGLFQFKLLQNVGFLIKPQHWPTLLSNFGFALPFVLLYRTRIPHAGLQRCLPIVGLWFGVMMIVGVVVEIRIFGELISYMSLVAALLVWQALHTRAPHMASA